MRRHSRAWHDLHDGPLSDVISARKAKAEAALAAPVVEIKRPPDPDRHSHMPKHAQQHLQFWKTGDRD